MSEPVAPQVECEKQHPALRVSDIAGAVEFYTKKLGFQLGFTWGEPPEMAGINLGEVQLFLERGTPSPKGCSVYFVVGNADELFEYQRANGVEILQTPGDRPYGLRDYRIRDLNGYELGFGHHIFNVGPPLEIERVDVPVRLEKRLAALLRDLAEYKHMSVNSCLEETLLHTLDGRWSAHESGPQTDRKVEAQAWDPLRQPCELSLRRGCPQRDRWRLTREWSRRALLIRTR